MVRRRFRHFAELPVTPAETTPSLTPELERFAALDAALARGIADAEAGRVIPIDEASTQLRAEIGVSDEKSLRSRPKRPLPAP
jgi:predicted transcriptional regulator